MEKLKMHSINLTQDNIARITERRMRQLTFGDAEQQGKRTRREVFLAEMDRVVPWEELLGVIEPHYPRRGQSGRQPYPLETMLRIHLLQQ